MWEQLISRTHDVEKSRGLHRRIKLCSIRSTSVYVYNGKMRVSWGKSEEEEDEKEEEKEEKKIVYDQIECLRGFF